MIPGEYQIQPGDIELNVGRRTVSLKVANSGDRPIQVGSHYHFFETNDALLFDRASTRGMRLNIPAGTAVPAGIFRRMPRLAARSNSSASLVSKKW